MTVSPADERYEQDANVLAHMPQAAGGPFDPATGRCYNVPLFTLRLGSVLSRPGAVAYAVATPRGAAAAAAAAAAFAGCGDHHYSADCGGAGSVCAAGLVGSTDAAVAGGGGFSGPNPYGSRDRPRSGASPAAEPAGGGSVYGVRRGLAVHPPPLLADRGCGGGKRPKQALVLVIQPRALLLGLHPPAAPAPAAPPGAGGAAPAVHAIPYGAGRVAPAAPHGAAATPVAPTAPAAAEAPAAPTAPAALEAPVAPAAPAAAEAGPAAVQLAPSPAREVWGEARAAAVPAALAARAVLEVPLPPLPAVEAGAEAAAAAAWAERRVCCSPRPIDSGLTTGSTSSRAVAPVALAAAVVLTSPPATSRRQALAAEGDAAAAATLPAQ